MVENRVESFPKLLCATDTYISVLADHIEGTIAKCVLATGSLQRAQKPMETAMPARA